jgi:hypothetical protein
MRIKDHEFNWIPVLTPVVDFEIVFRVLSIPRNQVPFITFSPIVVGTPRAVIVQNVTKLLPRCILSPLVRVKSVGQDAE